MFLFAIRMGIITPAAASCKYTFESNFLLWRLYDCMAGNQNVVEYAVGLEVAHDCSGVRSSGRHYLDCQ
jgi:hypothetical protein